MKHLRVLLILYALTLLGAGNSIPITLAWDDDSPDIAGYYLYLGVVSGAYGTPIPCITTKKTIYLPARTFRYAVVTAVSTEGLESLPSNEIKFEVRRTRH